MTRCGSQVPQPILTSDSYAHVKFVSNNANTFPGFQLKFEASVEGKNWHEMKEKFTFQLPCSTDINIVPQNIRKHGMYAVA